MEGLEKIIRSRISLKGCRSLFEYSKNIECVMDYATFRRRMKDPKTFRLYELEALARSFDMTVSELLGGVK